MEATKDSCSDLKIPEESVLGSFQLVDSIITELKGHMTCYKFECSNWWKIYL